MTATVYGSGIKHHFTNTINQLQKEMHKPNQVKASILERELEARFPALRTEQVGVREIGIIVH